MDAGLYSCGVFIDLKKAFDTVDHIILLCKLSHHRIRGIINLALYLTDTTQTTQVGASISSKGKILFGFLQGSVLRTLLFLIFINGVYSVSSKLNFYLFADDTNILHANNNLKSIESVVNDELREVCEWLNRLLVFSDNLFVLEFVSSLARVILSFFIPFNASLITT